MKTFSANFLQLWRPLPQYPACERHQSSGHYILQTTFKFISTSAPNTFLTPRKEEAVSGYFDHYLLSTQARKEWKEWTGFEQFNS